MRPSGAVCSSWAFCFTRQSFGPQTCKHQHACTLPFFASAGDGTQGLLHAGPALTEFCADDQKGWWALRSPLQLQCRGASSLTSPFQRAVEVCHLCSYGYGGSVTFYGCERRLRKREPRETGIGRDSQQVAGQTANCTRPASSATVSRPFSKCSFYLGGELSADMRVED